MPTIAKHHFPKQVVGKATEPISKSGNNPTNLEILHILGGQSHPTHPQKIGREFMKPYLDCLKEYLHKLKVNGIFFKGGNR